MKQITQVLFLLLVPLSMLAGCARPSTPRFFTEHETSILGRRLCDMAQGQQDLGRLQALSVIADERGGAYLVLCANTASETEAAELSKSLLDASGNCTDLPAGYPERWLSLSDEAGNLIRVYSPDPSTDNPGTRGWHFVPTSFASAAYAYPQMVCDKNSAGTRTVVQLMGFRGGPLPSRVVASIDFDAMFKNTDTTRRYGTQTFRLDVLPRESLLQ